MTSLVDIRAKVRKITGRPDVNQMSDATVDQYINNYYQYDLPEQYKSIDLKTTFSFTTQPNVDQYPLTNFSTTSDTLDLYYSFEPPVYASGYQINYYQSRDLFFNLYPSLYSLQQIGSGTGIVGPYTFTFTVGYPLLRNNILISAVDGAGLTNIAVDDGLGNLLQNTPATVLPTIIGTINYLTGAVVITFPNVIPAGNAINMKAVPYTPSRPLCMLFYDNIFTLRPVPDDAYNINIQAFIKPTALLATDSPKLQAWWQLLAYGAAYKIFLETLDIESVQKIQPFLQEQLNFAERRSLMQIKTQRPQTIYADDRFWGQNRIPIA